MRYRIKCWNKITIAITVLGLFLSIVGCSVFHDPITVNGHIHLEKRGYFTRCVLENLILGGAYNGKLPLNIDRLSHFHYKIIYRSGQVRAENIPYLFQLGIKSIVTLNTVSKKTWRQIKHFGLYHKEFNYRSTDLTYADIRAAIDQIMEFPEPVLVHCRAGADRTGIVIAALRATYGDTDAERLLAEMHDYCHISFNKYLYYEDLLARFIKTAPRESAP